MNKDEALRARQIGHKYLSEGNYEKAIKFLEKSVSMFDSPEARALLAKAKRGPDSSTNASSGASTANSSTGGFRRRTNASSATSSSSSSTSSTSAPQDTRPYTAEQVRVVKEITRCKDLYTMLGVERSATAVEIKKAYRKRAIKVHPDKNSAPGADEAFKSINRAFSILSDGQKRSEYDTYGETSDNPAQYARRQHADDFDPTDIFREVFGAQFGGGMGGPGVRMYHFGPGGFQRQGARGQATNADRAAGFLQILPILILFLLSFISLPQANEGTFSFKATTRFPIYHKTAEPHIYPDIPFYVSQDTHKRWRMDPRMRFHVEQDVMQNYHSHLENQCRTDKKDYRRRKLASMDPASCVELQNIKDFMLQKTSNSRMSGKRRVQSDP